MDSPVVWCTMILVISDHLSWSGSSQRNPPLIQNPFSFRNNTVVTQYIKEAMPAALLLAVKDPSGKSYQTFIEELKNKTSQSPFFSDYYEKFPVPVSAQWFTDRLCSSIKYPYLNHGKDFLVKSNFSTFWAFGNEVKKPWMFDRQCIFQGLNSTLLTNSPWF